MNVVWPIWLITLIVSFGFLEGYAIKEGEMTLSAWVWTVTKDWPLFPAILGLLFGGLLVHFFWTGQGLKMLWPHN